MPCVDTQKNDAVYYLSDYNASYIGSMIQENALRHARNLAPRVLVVPDEKLGRDIANRHPEAVRGDVDLLPIRAYGARRTPLERQAGCCRLS